MEAKQIYLFLFPLIIFFLLSTFSLQAESSPIIEQNKALEKKSKFFYEVVKAVGLPDYAAGDHSEWMLRAVGFFMEKFNWKYHFSGDEKRDVEEFNIARSRADRVLLYLIERLQLNPYRPYFGFKFSMIFYEIQHMEKENPVYPCFKAVWPACMARAPATPEGEVVYKYECAWEFDKKCL
ncbi:hypothetical protein M5K25_007968 [Dendrobium thyrsiflorum]|uniref:Uncharacterized protein n=1 Tax=Dendrobium thyrsiflorum TaxID=117978 RepID=A0ABD0V7K4_DENTH